MKRTGEKLFLYSRPSSQHRLYFEQANEIRFDGDVFIYAAATSGDLFLPVSGIRLGVEGGLVIKEYSWDKLLEIPYKECVLVFYVDASEPFGDENLTEFLFDKREKYEWVDYPATITALSRRGLIKVADSKSWLALDGRVFSFVDTEEYYEVDILGTQFGEPFAEKVVELWNSISVIDYEHNQLRT